MASPTPEPGSPEYRDALGDELRDLRTSGVFNADLSKLPRLCTIARKVAKGSNDVARIAWLLDAVIQDYGRRDRQVARIWFGLTRRTRHLPVERRHELAHKRFGEQAFDSFKGRTWETRYKSDIARRIDAGYASLLEREQQSPLEKSPSDPRTSHRRIRGVLAATKAYLQGGPDGDGLLAYIIRRSVRQFVFLAVALGTFLALAVTGAMIVRHERPTYPYRFSYPDIVRGSGDETMKLSGHFDGNPFVGHNSLVLVYANAIIIRIFPEPVGCNEAQYGTPKGEYFDIQVQVDKNTIETVPVGSPLRTYWLRWWKIHGADRTGRLLADSGSVILTKIDTTLGGIWRGRISDDTTAGSEKVAVDIHGTFVAEMCNFHYSKDD